MQFPYRRVDERALSARAARVFLNSSNSFSSSISVYGMFIAAIKSEIIDELEKHRDDELAELRDKRQKAAAASTTAVDDDKPAVSSADVVPVSIHCIHSDCVNCTSIQRYKLCQLALDKIMNHVRFVH